MLPKDLALSVIDGRPPRFSFLVGCRNAEDYIGQCIASVIAQDDADWECLVTDDASIDRTWAEMVRVTAGDPRFSLASNVNHLGYPRNALAMLARARGEIVLRLDGDDFLAGPTVLSAVRAAYDAAPGLAGTYGTFRYEPDMPTAHKPVAADWWEYDRYPFGALYTWRRAITLASLAAEPEAYVDPATGAYHTAFELALFCPVAYRGPVVHIPDITYVYRQHGRNMHWMRGVPEMVRAGQAVLTYWKDRITAESAAVV